MSGTNPFPRRKTVTNADGTYSEVVAIEGSPDNTVPLVTGGRYNTSAPVYEDGDNTEIQTDQNGNMKVREQYAPVAEDNVNGVIGMQARPVVTPLYGGTAFSARLNDVDIAVKTSPGNLLSVRVSNINAAVRYLQIHNKASAPTSGNSPVFSFVIPAGSSTAPSIIELDRGFFGSNGQYLDTGIAIGISTAADTFTAATTTDHIVNGTFV